MPAHRAPRRQHAGLAAGCCHRQHRRPDVHPSGGHAPGVPGRSDSGRALVAQLPVGPLPEAVEPVGVGVYDAGVEGTRRDGARTALA
eukprot:1513912-Pyramimonas_sp.AAC.1